MTELNGVMYLSAFEPRRGAELWKHDGSAAARVSDINEDANDAIKVLPKSSWPAELVALDGKLYFSATSRTNPPNYELWSFDGITVSQAANIRPDSGMEYGSYPKELTVFNGSLYFMANDGVNGWELWRHDATGTELININPGAAGSSAYPKYFTAFGTNLYFQAYTDANGFELWKTDGETAVLAADVNAGSGSSFAEGMVVYNGALYFSATDGESGYELWRFDGQSATLVTNINASGDAYPKGMMVWNGVLYFTADDGVHGWELWKYDGTNASLVADVNVSGDAFPSGFTAHDGALYFTATTPETGYELYKYDGNVVALAADVNEGPGDSFPRFLHSYNDQLIFSATADGSSNWELWAVETQGPPITPPNVSGISVTAAGLEIRVSARAGAVVTLEGSSDLSDWNVVSTVTASGMDVTFTPALDSTHLFYRVRVD